MTGTGGAPGAESLQADVVVVGAGSAGCALAARLSEDPALSVLLVEAGDRSRDPWLRIPIGYFKTVGHPDHDWGFETEPDPVMADRRMPWPRGRGPGGTSLINGLLYLRGHRRDYDRWAALGNPGWDWDTVLPVFRGAMRLESGMPGPTDGTGGPLSVTPVPRDRLSDAFVASARQAGVRAADDFNGGDNAGVGYFRLTTRRGERVSSARAFLEPALGRPNLRVLTGARALGVTLDGDRATGVTVQQGGRRLTLQARHEVVLCAGAIQSPHLLELSGIGAPATLERAGLGPRHALPGVGENLQDHLQVRPAFRVRGVETLNDIANSRLRSAREFLRWHLTRGGALAWGVYRAGAFLSVHDDGGWPDVQVHFGVVSFERPKQPPHPFPGVTLSACLLRPDSRGSVHAATADPVAPPAIRPGYLSAPSDRALALAAVRRMREIAATGPLASLVVQEHEPGVSAADDAALLAWIGRRAGTIFHPVGTCAMGPAGDPMAVVDARLRVHGLAGLRVADASIMPRIVSGNTNAPSIMIGERAAAMIREDLRG